MVDERSGVENELIVETTTFGAIPEGAEWADASSTTFPVAEFSRLYRPLDDAETALLALESAAEYEAATKGNAKRTSPWSVVA